MSQQTSYNISVVPLSLQLIISGLDATTWEVNNVSLHKY